MINQAFPLSFAQQRLWFLDQLDSETPSYNLLRAIRIEGALDVSALSRTLQTITDRHESLRTMIVSQSGEPCQFVQPSMTLELLETDLSHLPELRRMGEVARLAGEEARKVFDLSTAPLFRLRLIRLEPEAHVLVLVMHHIITDGWSMSILFREIAAIYQHIVEAKPLELRELAVQYPDFAQWQRESTADEVLDRQLKYWKSKLGGSPRFLELPTDRLRPAIQTHRGASRCLVLDRELTNTLKSLSQREGATLFMTLLSAFQILLWRYTSAEDILIGTPIAGRNELELENLIGLFVNTIVM
ncbi:MAG: condensation domain-containing protein, partial [Acidobacteriota bacterium]|nr:condensation domain-containing protein [Acidobacteriota bacterium]